MSHQSKIKRMNRIAKKKKETRKILARAQYESQMQMDKDLFETRKHIVLCGSVMGLENLEEFDFLFMRENPNYSHLVPSYRREAARNALNYLHVAKAFNEGLGGDVSMYEDEINTIKSRYGMEIK